MRMKAGIVSQFEYCQLIVGYRASFRESRFSVLIRRTTNKLRIARHPTTIRWEPPLASAPAVSKFGGIVLSQCGAACV